MVANKTLVHRLALKQRSLTPRFGIAPEVRPQLSVFRDIRFLPGDGMWLRLAESLDHLLSVAVFEAAIYGYWNHHSLS
jgi:hypothetical protein